MKIPGYNLKKYDRTELPLVPMRELVVFPNMVVPFLVGRQGSIDAVEEAMKENRKVFLAFQRDDKKEPTAEDLHEIGTVATILQMLKLPDGTIRLLVEGERRGRIARFVTKAGYFRVSVNLIPDSAEPVDRTTSALMRTVNGSFIRFSQLYKKLTPETLKAVEKAESPDKLVNLIAGNLPLRPEKKLEILAQENVLERLENLAVSLEAENEVLGIQQQIQVKVRKRMEKNQREYFLNEQMKEIHRELGRDDEDPSGAKELKQRIEAKQLPAEVAEKTEKELRRLSRLQPMSPEAGVLRTYVEWIADLPWNERTRDHQDIERAERVLDEDHYDMKIPKERVLDFIAVRQLAEKGKGPILCFVGPPGTGKTSLGKSVARALGRSFVRISLGGIRDEAEIRGHRKTYVGALPGKILQSMKKAGSSNPVFLLDEIDKMSSDFRGDPAAALLEVLDPEQNTTFVDHYLEVPYDLSDVMFITTANSAHTIPHALRDRMEMIEIPGYTEYEKLKIAEGFIIPKQLRENGLAWADIRFRKDAVREIIHDYTMESGVRNLERQIAQVVRKLAREAVKQGYRSGGQEAVEPAAEEVQVPAAERASAAAEATGPLDPPVLVAVGAGSKTLHRTAGGSEGDSSFWDDREGRGEPGDPPDDDIPSSGYDRENGETGEEADLLRDGEIPSDPAPEDSRVQPAAERTEAGQEEEREDGESEARAVSPTEPFRMIVTAKNVQKYLGHPRYQRDLVYRDQRPGLAHGLAWTENGGTLLPVEVSTFDGRGELILTGNLGDVMKESARTAISFIRAHSNRFNLSGNFSVDRDIHIHVPEGAIPKDGPSAGITLAVAVVSALTGVCVKPGIAMTGEITLTGRLLKIGGIKEKILAAHRNKMEAVLMPESNRNDTDELPREVTSSIRFIFAESALEALEALFPESVFPYRKHSVG